MNCNAAVTNDLRYPVGRFNEVGAIEESRRASIGELASLPRRMRDAVEGLTDRQLDTPYRPGGWTVRQVVHHVSDSHLNAYVRFKLALTEDTPTIKPYDESAWACLADSNMPTESSLQLLEAVHSRWVELIRTTSTEQFGRKYRHPEYPDRPLTLDWLLQHYAWHSRHHLAHITSLRRREGW